ncbi:MAG: hypothetical protein ABIQ16_16070 [Polyangiaceae bacterium]
MPSVIERATTGRAKCRACSQPIAKGDERFGEALPNAYGEGESLFWFHLRCAACSRPESVLPVLEHSPGALSEREALVSLVRDGIANPRLSRIAKAERATSGRARCRHCRDLIEQGALRLSLQMFEEGRFNPIGTIHATCAVHYFAAEPALERLRLPCNQLTESELAEVVAEMREGAKREVLPGLAKTGSEEPEQNSRKSS